MAIQTRVRSDGMPRALIVLLCGAGAVITLAGMREIASIVGPVVLALVLTIAVAPIRTRLQRRGAPTWAVVAAPLAVILLVLITMVAVLAYAVTQLAALIPTYSVQFGQLVVSMRELATRLGLSDAQINKALGSIDPGQLFELAQALLSGLLGVTSSLFLIVVLVLAMCLDAPALARLLESSSGERPALVNALAAFTDSTRRYIVVSTIFGLICATLDVGALYLLSVPLPVLWGVLAFITNYIPNIGFVIGLIPPTLLALLDEGPRTALLVIAAYMVINFVIQSLIQPRYLGQAVGLSTTATFLSLILWAWVLGALGALLAIPLSLLARALLIDSDPGAGWAARLISGSDGGVSVQR